MDVALKSTIQSRIAGVGEFRFRSLHEFDGVPRDFRPWTCGLSPSALYNCSLGCRKRMGIKAHEVKWMSIKRWVSATQSGIVLPAGVFLSIKRREDFVALPKPHLEKKEFTLLMFPYGNVWSQRGPDVPITEDWLWTETEGMLLLEALVRKDAARPVRGYFRSCYEYMKSNPDQIGIHLKRKKKEPQVTE
jgi:hypothetical protein